MSQGGAAFQLCLSPPFPISAVEGVNLLPSSIDSQGLGDLEIVQRGFRGLEVAQSVDLSMLVT